MAPRDHSHGGGGGWGLVRDAKPYFTARNYFVTLIFCYKFNSTDAFTEGLGVYTPPPHLPARYAPVHSSMIYRVHIS